MAVLELRSNSQQPPASLAARTVLLLAAALIASACAPQRTTESSTTATTVLLSTTTSAATTTTTIPVAATITIEDPLQDDLLFDVTGIESGSITGFAGAGTNFADVAVFATGTVALEATGRTDESIDGTLWREIWISASRTAWVDQSFLEPNHQAPVRFADLPCSGFGTAQGELARSGPSDSDADHVAQIWQVAWPDCTRVVIALGADFDFDASSPLAAEVPPDVSVEAFSTWVRVTLPGIRLARGDASEDFGDVTVVVARSFGGVLVVDAHTGAPGEYFARFLVDPARIVIDILPANVAAVVVAPPLIGEGVVLAEALPPSVHLPLTISGYSRWFEAGGIVIVRRLDKEPGVGEVVSARVTGEFVVNPGTGTTWGVYATDWLDAWGRFSFELDNLGSGEYEVFIGECQIVDDPDTCEYFGAYLPMTVAP